MEPTSDGPSEELVDRYRRNLVVERGLVVGTVRYYVAAACVFLADWGDASGSQLREVSAPQVPAFVIQQSAHRGVGSMKILVTLFCGRCCDSCFWTGRCRSI